MDRKSLEAPTPMGDQRFTSSSDRRRVLLAIGLLGGAAAGALAIPGAVLAAPGLSQKAASYQGAPKGKQQCDNCKQWAPPAACKIVQGAIAANGWCTLYGPK